MGFLEYRLVDPVDLMYFANSLSGRLTVGFLEYRLVDPVGLMYLITVSVVA